MILNCPSGKIVFASAADARLFIRGGGHRKAPVSGRLRPYLCPRCDRYHVTSQSKAEARRRR